MTVLEALRIADTCKAAPTLHGEQAVTERALLVIAEELLRFIAEASQIADIVNDALYRSEHS